MPARENDDISNFRVVDGGNDDNVNFQKSAFSGKILCLIN